MDRTVGQRIHKTFVVALQHLGNYTLSGKRRFELSVGISYGDDLEKVKQVALKAVKNISVLDAQQLFYIYLLSKFCMMQVNFCRNSIEKQEITSVITNFLKKVSLKNNIFKSYTK